MLEGSLALDLNGYGLGAAVTETLAHLATLDGLLQLELARPGERQRFFLLLVVVFSRVRHSLYSITSTLVATLSADITSPR